MLKLLAPIALIASAMLAIHSASAASFATGPRIAQNKLPSLNVPTHPQIPRICVNPLDKGPGARKCG